MLQKEGMSKNPNLVPLGDKSERFLLCFHSLINVYFDFSMKSSSFSVMLRVKWKLTEIKRKRALGKQKTNLNGGRKLPRRNKRPMIRGKSISKSKKQSRLTNQRRQKNLKFWAKRILKDNLSWLVEWNFSWKRSKLHHNSFDRFFKFMVLKIEMYIRICAICYHPQTVWKIEKFSLTIKYFVKSTLK